jgi:hypothetical protein
MRLMRIIVAACALAALTLVACDDGNGRGASGSPRTFLMGFSSLPRELNAASYADTIEFAGDHGDIVLIQRELPWTDFLPGAQVSESVARTTASERDAVNDKDLRLFFAIDVTDGATGRDRLVGLPPDLSGRGFADPGVRAAFASYAEYVAINYQPDYLALGVEMNLYYREQPDDFDDFVSLYDATYDIVKQRSPKTQVTVTFQYEDMQGLLPRDDPHFADWHLLDLLSGRMDFVAISTYPSFAYGSAAAVPDNYYRKLQAFTDRPIAFAEMGFASTPGQDGVNSGTEQGQEVFLQRALREAQELHMPFAVWFSIWDPQYARGTAFSAFQSIGLRRADDTPKPAWEAWEEAARRPYDPGAETAQR